MIFPERETWEKWGIEIELHKFFVQRWHEIFSEDTYDSWQIRTSNVKTILYEILDAIEVVGNVHTFHRNIEILIDEVIQIAKKDCVISDSFPYVQEYLAKLKEKYKSDVKDESKKDLESFKRLVMVIKGYIKDYKNELIKILNEMISTPPDHYKERLYYLIMSLAVELKSEGYSIASLQDSLNILIDTAEADFTKRYENLVNKFDGKTLQYDCSFLVSWPGKIINLEEFGVEISNNKVGELEGEEEKKFFDQDLQPIVAALKVESNDPFSARADAEEKLENLFAFSIFYRPTKDPTIKHQLALVSSNDGERFLVGPDISRLKYIKDSKKAAESIRDFTILYKKLGIQDSGQITASLQHHKLSINAPTDEARLVNLWIALESIMQQGKGNIIERICTYVPPSISLDYVFQMMRNLPINIRKLWRQANTASLRAKLKHSNEYILHPADMLDILMDDENGELIKDFLQFATNYPLLIHRTYHLWKDMFRTPKKLSETIEKHKKNIEWQLVRIYRARNLLMHRGICPPRTRQLIQHLHSYYILTMHSLVGDLKRNPTWCICDAFEHRLLLYDHFQGRLKNNQSKPLSKAELLNPILSLSNDNRDKAWPIE